MYTNLHNGDRMVHRRPLSAQSRECFILRFWKTRIKYCRPPPLVELFYFLVFRSFVGGRRGRGGSTASLEEIVAAFLNSYSFFSTLSVLFSIVLVLRVFDFDFDFVCLFFLEAFSPFCFPTRLLLCSPVHVVMGQNTKEQNNKEGEASLRDMRKGHLPKNCVCVCVCIPSRGGERGIFWVCST